MRTATKLSLIAVVIITFMAGLSLPAAAIWWSNADEYLVGTGILPPRVGVQINGQGDIRTNDLTSPLKVPKDSSLTFKVYYYDQYQLDGFRFLSEVIDRDAWGDPNSYDDKLECQWNFGDGTPVVTTQNFGTTTSHTFTSAGLVTVNWKMRDMYVQSGVPHTAANDTPLPGAPQDWDAGGALQLEVVAETTAPSILEVIDDGVSTTSLTTLHATWSSTYSEPAIDQYIYAIGTSPGASDISTWRQPPTPTVTEILRSDLTLTSGSTYYFSVKARNGAGLWSQTKVSDGITCVAASAIRVKQDSPGIGNPPSFNGASWESAYQSISEAMTAASDGDEIWVAAGTNPYYEQVTLKPGVKLFGGFAGTETVREQRDWTKHVTILEHNNIGPVVASTSLLSDATEINGFTIQGGIYNGGIYVAGSLVIANNIIRDNINAYGEGAGICCNGGSPKIIGNVIVRNFGGGIYCYGGGSPVIVNNTIVDNIINDTSAGVTLVYNSQTDADNSLVANNIIAFNDKGTDFQGGTPPFKNNCVFRNDTGNTLGTRGIACNPLFVDRTVDDYHILPGSMCIDNGDDSSVPVICTDLDGEARQINVPGKGNLTARVDIGADEYQPCLVLHVSLTGNDSSDGWSWSTAKRTIGAALDNAGNGDQVWVATGTYKECILLRKGVGLYGGFTGTEMSIAQRDPNAYVTTIDGINLESSVVKAAYGLDSTAVIDGFTIRGGIGTLADSVRAGGGIFCRFSSPTISNNILNGNTASSGGGIYCFDSGAIITNNTITECTASWGGAIFLNYNSPKVTGNVIKQNTSSGGVIYCQNGNPTVASNVVASNTGFGIFSPGMSSGPGVKIVNNTVVGNNNTGIFAFYSSPTVANNIVVSNRVGISGSGGSPSLSHNCVYGNTTNYQDVVPGTGDISAVPSFENQAAGNYHLATGSPCIGVGDDTVVQTAGLVLDIDRQARVMGEHLDMGADEFGDGPGPLYFDPPAGRYYGCLGVKITCATPGVTIRYAIDSDPDETNPTSRVYDPEGVVVIQPTQTLKARAYVTGGTPGPVETVTYSKLAGDPYPTPEQAYNPGSNIRYTCRQDIVLPGTEVEDIRLTRIYMPKTMHFEWNSGGHDSFQVQRILGSDVVTMSTAQNHLDDIFDFASRTTYTYAVRGMGHTDHTYDDLPLRTDQPENEVYYRVTWPEGPWKQILVTPVQVVASDNQTVDARLDTRYVENVPVDFNFGSGIFRGGLFVGYAQDPADVARSFMKFPLTPPAGSNDRLWAGCLNAYYTGSRTNATATNVGCHSVSHDLWKEATLKWSNAPSLDVAAATDVISVVQDEPNAGHWCNWFGMFAPLAREMYGDRVLSAALASTNESLNGWAYFAKEQYDANLAPQVLYAYGNAPVIVVDLTLSTSTVKGGNTVVGTVKVNGPVPLDTKIRIYSDSCKAQVPGGVTIPTGEVSGTFIVSTAVVPVDTDVIVTADSTQRTMGQADSPFTTKTLTILP